MTVPNIDELKDNFLIDIKVIATMEEVPYDMILNWDQTTTLTGNFVPKRLVYEGKTMRFHP